MSTTETERRTTRWNRRRSAGSRFTSARFPSCVRAFLFGAVALPLSGCTNVAEPAPGYSNLSFRDAGGTEVARGWLELPAKLPGPGKAFGGAFRLVSSRGEFPSSAAQGSTTYTAFVGEGGWTFNANLNPGVADRNITLAGKVNADEVRGTWSLSTIGGAKPGGTFVLEWERK